MRQLLLQLAIDTYVCFDRVQKTIVPAAAVTGLASEVWDIPLSDHSDPLNMGGQIVRQAYNGWLGEGIHVSDSGEAGQVAGINGTSANPCSSLVDAKVLADFFLNY